MVIPPRDPPPIPPARWQAVTAVLALVAAVWLAYASGLGAPFIMDDASSVTANRSIRSMWPIWPVIYYEHGEGRTHDGRPLLNLSLAVNRAITGTSPIGFRVVNILVHCGNAVLILALAHELLARPAVPQAVRDRAGEIAFAASLLWAVHPLGTGAVTYVIQRAESLGAFMILATVLVTVRGMLAADAGRRTWPLPLVSLLSALAGTAKETSVAIPLVTLLIDRALLAGSWRSTLRHWPWHLAAAASWPSVILMLTAWGGRGSSAGFASEASPWLYLLTQAKAIWLYFARIVWPQGLVFDYGDFLSSGLAESGGWLLLTAAVFIAVGYGYARRPVAFLGPLLFFVLLGPTSSIIPVKTQTIAEHRVYLASAALIVPAVAAAWLVAPERLALSPRFCGLAAAAVALALGLSTAARNREFVTPEILWRKALAAEPRNERAMINLAAQLIVRKDDPGALDEAERLLSRVAETGRYPKVYNVNLGSLAKAHKRYPEALAAIDAVLRYPPADPATLADRGFVLWKLGRLPEALAELEKALALDHQIAPAWLNRGNVLLDLGRREEAEQSFTRSVEVDPKYAKGWDHLGIARQSRGDRSAALDAFNRAVEFDPKDAEAVYNRGNLLSEIGRVPDAIADYGRAIEIDPRLASAWFNRGVLRLRRGDVAAARADFDAFSRLGGALPPAVLAALSAAGAQSPRPSDSAASHGGE
jgi:tetratricopeptide (TPR) repeat protein